MIKISDRTAAGYQVEMDNDGARTELQVTDPKRLVQTVAHFYAVPHERDGCPLCARRTQNES